MRMPETYMELIMFGEVTHGESKHVPHLDQQHLLVSDLAALHQLDSKVITDDHAVVVNDFTFTPEQFFNAVDGQDN